MVDAPIWKAIDGHGFAAAQIEETRCSINCPSVADPRIAIAYQGLDAGLVPAQQAEDDPQHSALGVPAATVMEPQSCKTQNFTWLAAAKEAMQVVCSDTYYHHSEKDMTGKDTEIQNAAAGVAERIVVDLTHSTSRL